jgi:acetyl esterase
MHLHAPSVLRTWRRPRSAAALLVSGLIASTVACTSPAAPATRLPDPPKEVTVEEALPYWTDGQVSLLLDACLPVAPAGPLPAVVLVHGGGFTGGHRSSEGMRSLCEWTAEQGMAAFSVDYRLAPEFTYPAPIDDLANAVLWLRQPDQATRFGIDPAKIGLFGSSAGATLALTLATRGQGPLDAGDRVAAVVSLSGVSVMTPNGLSLGSPSQQAVDMALAYLGCVDPVDCPNGGPASALAAVDPSDPPTLLVNGTGEMVPREQADAMGAMLESAGVPVELLILGKPDHGTALLTADVRGAVRSFLEEYL